MITRAGKLPAKYVIHTVGPVWNQGKSNEEALLASAYLSSLQLAVEHEVKTIAFPNISTGIYRFPKQRAAEIAVETIQQFMATNPGIEKVIFVCFDGENLEIYKELLKLA